MYNFKKLKELRRKATTDEKMNGSFVRDVGVQKVIVAFAAETKETFFKSEDLI